MSKVLVVKKDMIRICDRPGCGDTLWLGYSYGWIEGRSELHTSHGADLKYYDLCEDCVSEIYDFLLKRVER